MCMGSDMRQRARFENASLEAVEATLGSNFMPEGWLDPLTPPTKKLKLSLNNKKPRVLRSLCPRVVFCVQWHHPILPLFSILSRKLEQQI